VLLAQEHGAAQDVVDQAFDKNDGLFATRLITAEVAATIPQFLTIVERDPAAPLGVEPETA
jgi:hypothetical protein